MSNSPKDAERERRDAETYFAEIRDDRNFASHNLSTQIRSTLLAILALTWLLLNGTEDSINEKFGCFSDSLMWLAALCISALAADFLQGFISAHETEQAATSSAEALSDERFGDVGYDDTPLRAISNGLYYGKCAMVVIAAIWIVALIYRALDGTCLNACS